MKKYILHDREIPTIFIEYNIQRMAITSCIILLFQVSLLIDKHFFSSPLYICGFSFLTLLSIGYLVYFFLYYSQFHGPVKKRIYLLYWFFLCIAFLPYIIADLQTTSIPLNMVLCYALLMAIPILSTIEFFIMFSSFGIVNLILCYVLQAKTSVYVLTITLSIAGFILSYIIQGQYTNLIYRFKYESDMDYLTNLYNRKGGIKKIHNLLSTCIHHDIYLGICMIDIDYFKDYNDRYGHLQGDQTLQKVANCIKTTLLRENDIVCRMGGEEFLVCFTCNSHKDIWQMAERLRNAVLDLMIPCCRKDDLQYVSISIGTSAYIPHFSDCQIHEMQIIKEADDALYNAKRKGRNQVCHYHSLKKEK